MNEVPPTIESLSPTPVESVREDKTIAIVAYLTLIGFIVAIILHMNKKTRLGAYHLRQALGLVLTATVIGFCAVILGFIPILGILCIFGCWIFLFVLWLLGIIAAINGELKPTPVLGSLYQKWFGTAFD